MSNEKYADGQPAESRNDERSGSTARPWWLGHAILARHDPNVGYTTGNILWRTALSAEEAETDREIYVGAALRERLLAQIKDLGGRGAVTGR
jgi:hypothetical protein